MRPAISREDLPITFAVDRIALGGQNMMAQEIPFFKFFDHNEGKADRLIAHNLVAGGSGRLYLDKSTKEGYYSQQRGNDDWGSHVVVKFKAKLS
ncbi:hypothetical protein [Pontibacter korlensis]|uniref:hypothetical protein n=1 Tax=Pontibacter korlensis TaxID=400092 RepID=UPI001F17B46C|nr:hypothetical protein [Pontibacter korlensis]